MATPENKGPDTAQNAPPAEADGSGSMFDVIAKRYDLLNSLISFGLHGSWRRRLIRALGPIEDTDEVLDVATGTADVALAIARKHPAVRVSGLDPSKEMLAVGQSKTNRSNAASRITLVAGDAQAMPFETNRFAASCISFGIRNVPDRLLGLKEMARTTRAGGKVVILELSEPRGGLLSGLARFHVHHVVPWVGGLLSGSQEYRYLQESIQAFPPPEQFCDLMRQAGLRDVTAQRLSFGAAYIYVGTAP